MTDVGLPDPEIPRDAQVSAVSVPASAVMGDSVPVTVTVRNNGDIAEGINVTLGYQEAGATTTTQIGNQVVETQPFTNGNAMFTWDSSCAGAPGSFALSATVSIPADSNSGNNQRSESISLTGDREIRIVNPVGPTTVSRSTPGGTQFSVTLVNGATQAENGININSSDTSTTEGPGTIQWLGASRPPISLTCDQSRELYFVYFPPSVGASGPQAHTLTLTLAPSPPIPGDDPTNNSVTIPITVVP